MKAYKDFLGEAMSSKNFNQLKNLNKTIEDKKKPGGAIVKRDSSAIVPTGNDRTIKEPIGKSVADKAARKKPTAGYMSTPAGVNKDFNKKKPAKTGESSVRNAIDKKKQEYKDKPLEKANKWKKRIGGLLTSKGGSVNTSNAGSGPSSTEYRRG